METHKIKGNFCKKYWNDEKERNISFPSTLAEFSALAKAGKLTVDGKDFKLGESSLCQWAYRGFSLQHQGAEPMSEDEKIKAKEERKSVKTKGSFISALSPEDQLAMIIKAESAGSDCSAIRAALKLPPK